MTRRDKFNQIDTVEPICVECGRLAELSTGAVAYPHLPAYADRPVYLCACGARVGCHPGTTLALGRPAGPVTARARERAHRELDLLWKHKAEQTGGRGAARKAAYKWLARELGIGRRQCHIGWMTAEEADRVTALCKPYADKIRARLADARRHPPEAAPADLGPGQPRRRGEPP